MSGKIEQYKTVKRWINGIQVDLAGNLHTSRYYLRWLKKFVDWIGKNLDQIIEERKQQLKSPEIDVAFAKEEEENCKDVDF